MDGFPDIVGDVPFLFDADDLALDFLNTSGIREGRSTDLLTSPRHVVDWLVAAGIVGADAGHLLEAHMPEVRLLWNEAVRLREAISAGVSAFAAGTLVPERVVQSLNRVLSARTTGMKLEARGPGLVLVEQVLGSGVRGHLAPIAEAAAELLTKEKAGRIRRCAHEACTLWYRDTSKNGSRRWCSMARCGNRAKVAAHYRRHHSEE